MGCDKGSYRSLSLEHFTETTPLQTLRNLTKRTVNQDELKFNLLRQIAENPDSSQRELAVELGVSLGSVNYCLKALIDVGLVKMGNFARSQDKRNYAYMLTPKGVAEKTALTLRFLKRKQSEYESLQLEIDILQSELRESSAK